MFGSDVLDAAAIGAGAALLGGIIAGVFSYLTTRANIQAKRSEIAFEKRLEAFRETYEALSRYLTATLDLRHSATIHQAEAVLRKFNPDELPEKADELSEKVRAFEKNRDLFYQAYHKNRVFIPKHIDDILSVFYQEQIGEKLLIDARNTKGEVRQSLEKQTECFNQVLEEMHKFVGFK